MNPTIKYFFNTIYIVFLFIGNVKIDVYPIFSSGSNLNEAVHSDTINVLSFGLIPDGKFDNTPAFQTIIDSIVSIRTVIFFPPAESEYLFRNTVIIKGKKGLSIGSDPKHPARLKFESRSSIGIRLDQSLNVKISYLHFIGRGETNIGADAAPIKIRNSKRVFITNCIVENGITNGIEGFLSDSCVISDNIVFGTKNYNGIGWAGGIGNRYLRNRCYGNRGQGIEIRSQHDALVEENVCFENGAEGEQSSGITVECEDGSIPIERIEKDGNMFYLPYGRTGYSIGDVRMLFIKNKETKETILLRAEQDAQSNFMFRVESGSIDIIQKLQKVPYKGAKEDLLDYGSSNVRVARNTVMSNKGYGIYIVSSRRDKLRNVTVNDNVIIGNERAGIMIATASDIQEMRTTKNVIIERNVLERNGWKKNEWPIWLYFADSIHVANNIFRNNARNDSVCVAGTMNVRLE